MPYQSLELLADAEGDQAVRADWAALREAGLPSQADHPGATNAPHLTLVAAPSVEPARERAAALLAPLLPVPVRTAGLVVLGGDRVTLARVVDVPDPLLAAVLELRGLLPQLPHQGWLAHVTLARRLDRADLQRAVEAVGHADVVLQLAQLRHWDPETATVTTLAQV